MEVTYALTRQDAAAFRQFHANRKNKLRWLTPLSNGFLVLVWLVQLFFVAHIFYIWRYWFGHSPLLWQYNILHAHQYLLTMFLLFTLLLVYLFWGQKWLMARALPSDALLARPRTVSVSPGGVRVVSEHEDMQRAWADMTTIESDRDRLYLYTTDTHAVVVPRHAFASANEARAFEAEARTFHADPRLQSAPGDAVSDDGSVWPPPPSYSAVKPADAAPADPLDTPVPETVEVSYVTRPADFWRAQGYALARQPAALAPILVIYTIGVALWIVPRMAVGPALGLSLGIALLVSLLTLAGTTHSAIKKRFVKFADGRPCRTVARPDGLFDITPEGRTTLRWPDVAAVTVRGGDVLVRTVAGGGLIVPRSAFGSERERTAFVEALRGFQQAAGA